MVILILHGLNMHSDELKKLFLSINQAQRKIKVGLGLALVIIHGY